MRAQQSSDAPDKELSKKKMLMEEMWAEAANEFNRICGMSLQKGDVKSFDDLRKRIESTSSTYDDEQEGKWEHAKDMGLKTLDCLKVLVGAASQATSVFPIPSSVANITCTALCFVFTIPKAIKGYNDAINQVFSEVSSALSQFRIYTSMSYTQVDSGLIEQIHSVMISFVKVCAHVVKYRQGSRLDRFWKQFKSIFDGDKELSDEMQRFNDALKKQRDVEGTFTLAMVLETKDGIIQVLEKCIVFSKMTEETRQVVQETQKGVQALRDTDDRVKSLSKIRDTLGVPDMVRFDTNTTQTCTSIAKRCSNHTGEWIWTHTSYIAWTAPKDENTAASNSHVLLVSGPATSGKTMASALITKRLEEEKGRTFVAHYFFPTSSTKKLDDDEKNPVSSALKYMAFQIARVDPITRMALSKACDAAKAFRRSASLDKLDALWDELEIGGSATESTFYLIFDGLENLHDEQVKILLSFIFSSKLASESGGRVRVLVSGTDSKLDGQPGVNGALRIQMQEHNGLDMAIVIKEELNKQGMLEHARSGSDQDKAKMNIVDKLPKNVRGSYSLLQFGLEAVIRLLSTRSGFFELDQMLDQSMNSHEAAFKNLQRSLTGDEINELNELLKWVMFGGDSDPMTLQQLEAAMVLYSGTESLASLQYIITAKYSTILEISDDYVYVQDDVKNYLQKQKAISAKSNDRATISMTISINNVDQEHCAHFLWDLAHKAIREKFNFDFDGSASSANALLSSSNHRLAVDEIEAHHTIITRTFKYLSEEQKDQTKDIGAFLICWLPYHLGRLRQLEDDGESTLMPHEHLEIGQSLYTLFKDEEVFRRHGESFEQTWWGVDEMRDVQKWLTDSAVVRKVDKNWREEVRQATTPTRGYLKIWVGMVVKGFLRERRWNVRSAYDWIFEFMRADDEKEQQLPKSPSADTDGNASSNDLSTFSTGTNWDDVSAWCQKVLEISDSELDSLWWERLAEVSSLLGDTAETVQLLWQRAIEKVNPSWRCFLGLGKVIRADHLPEAIAQVALALKGAESEGATPRPESKDLVDLHLLLGQYTYDDGRMQDALEHYLIASKSVDKDQAMKGQLGHLKACFGSGFLDEEATRQSLENLLVLDDKADGMVDILKMVALDPNHDALISKLFAVAKRVPDLLKRVVGVMESITSKPVPLKEHTTEAAGNEHLADEEFYAVLLYDRGVAAYTYKVSRPGIEPVSEALRLWNESRNLLSNSSSSSILSVQQNVEMALAILYFQSVLDSNDLDQIDALQVMAKDGSNLDAVGFLGALYALRKDKHQARKALIDRVELALRILVDDIPENDVYGFSTMQKTLEQYQDFENAAVALSLQGQPDLVTDALHFEAEDIIEENKGVDARRVLDIVNQLARETVQIVKSTVPDSSQQFQRIEVAIAHIDFLVATGPEVETKAEPETGSDIDEAQNPGNHGKEDVLTTTSLEIVVAHRLLKSRLSTLSQTYAAKLDTSSFQWNWSCDGCTPNCKRCPNEANFDRKFYHCIYCSNRDFCADCLTRLRNPESGAEITACSAKHRWLEIPPMGSDIYVGTRAKSVRMPSEVRPANGDEQILEIVYFEGESGEDITVDAWMERLATEWGIDLGEIRREMPVQIMPDEEGEGESERIEV